jgi:hypothetical protein
VRAVVGKGGFVKSRIPSPFLKLAGTWALWLLALLFFAYLAMVLNPGQSTVPVPWNLQNYTLCLFRYDASYYLDIARYGYRDFQRHHPLEKDYLCTAFFPLYPLLVRAASYPLLGHYRAAALAVSWACLLLALFYLHSLARLYGADNGDQPYRACLYLLIFPTAVFLALPYSESAFLLTATGALYHARRAQWGRAALWACLASAARPVGLAAGLACGVEALRQVGWKPGKLKRGVAFLLLSPLGLAIYMAYLWAAFGNPFIFARAQAEGSGWQRGFNPFAFPQAVWRLFRHPVFTSEFAKYLYLVVFTTAFALLTLEVFRRHGPSLGVFSAFCLLAPMITSPPGDPLLSMNRMVVVIFPAFMVLARGGENRDFERLYLVLGALGLALFTALFVYGMWAG